MVANQTDTEPPGSGRCRWAGTSRAMLAYHDEEWGVPSHDDRYLFELLVLEGAQAGLSWSTVLNKRAHYRQVFDGFDATRVATYGEETFAPLLADPGIIRNRLKIRAAVANARTVLDIQREFGSFSAYLWAWVGGTPEVHQPRLAADVPVRSDLSDQISKDLKRRGCTFVGSTIMYAFLQAAGLIDDHVVSCPAKQTAGGTGG